MRNGHETLVVGGDEFRFSVTSAESAGQLLTLEVLIAPGGGPPALHRHDPFELYRVERGELTFDLEDAGGDGPPAMEDVLTLASAHGVRVTRALQELA